MNDDWDEWGDWENNSHPHHEGLESALIKVDPSLVAEIVSLALSEFKKTFDYELRLELESRTYSSSNGYLAAFFTPTQHNHTEMYYTLIHCPNYRKLKDQYKYTLDFTDSLYYEDGTDRIDAEVIELSVANNREVIVKTLIEHWKNLALH